MRRLICAFVVCIWHEQVFSWRGSYVSVSFWYSFVLCSRQALEVVKNAENPKFSTICPCLITIFSTESDEGNEEENIFKPYTCTTTIPRTDYWKSQVVIIYHFFNWGAKKNRLNACGSFMTNRLLTRAMASDMRNMRRNRALTGTLVITWMARNVQEIRIHGINIWKYWYSCYNMDGS